MSDIEIPKRPVGPHPGAETLLAAVRSAAGSPEARGALRHAATCAECSKELVHIEAFERAARMGDRRTEAAWICFRDRRSRPFGPRTRLWVMAAAAAAAILAAVALPLMRRGLAPSGGETERGAGSGVRLVSPRGIVSRPPSELIFENPVRASLRATIFDAGRSFEWTSPATTGGRVSIPEGERKQFSTGTRYYWTLLGGEVTAPVASFRVGSQTP